MTWTGLKHLYVIYYRFVKYRYDKIDKIIK